MPRQSSELSIFAAPPSLFCIPRLVPGPLCCRGSPALLPGTWLGGRSLFFGTAINSACLRVHPGGVKILVQFRTKAHHVSDDRVLFCLSATSLARGHTSV